MRKKRNDGNKRNKVREWERRNDVTRKRVWEWVKWEDGEKRTKIWEWEERNEEWWENKKENLKMSVEEWWDKKDESKRMRKEEW